MGEEEGDREAENDEEREKRGREKDGGRELEIHRLIKTHTKFQKQKPRQIFSCRYKIVDVKHGDKQR